MDAHRRSLSSIHPHQRPLAFISVSNFDPFLMSIAPSLLTDPKLPRSPAAGDLAPDFGRLNGSPAWFQARARAAWDEFQSLPLPGPKDEAWRYSSAKKLALETLRIAAQP